MEHGEKTIIESMQQVRGCSEKEAGDGDGEQHQQRHHVLSKLLDRDCSAIACAPEESKSDSAQHHDGRNIENVERDGSRKSAEMKRGNLLAENECPIDFLIVWRALKMYPAKRQREGDGSSQDASPGDQPVSGPAG